MKKPISTILEYFKDNWGVIFILGFQVLLITAAALLVSGDSVIANEVSIYAYILLVIGVTLQLLSHLRGREEFKHI